MPPEEKRRYKYEFNLRAGDSPEPDAKTRREIEQFVFTSLSLLTGGCEICAYSKRMYCEKQGRPVEPGDVRCASFVGRPSSAVSRAFD
ncbi:MAG: hypothetical protein JRN08_03610 [Nitrososphaerota archaeon]|nr:hypothetical protein [Nitrososphaerota archaeon]